MLLLISFADVCFPDGWLCFPSLWDGAFDLHLQ